MYFCCHATCGGRIIVSEDGEQVGQENNAVIVSRPKMQNVNSRKAQARIQQGGQDEMRAIIDEFLESIGSLYCSVCRYPAGC